MSTRKAPGPDETTTLTEALADVVKAIVLAPRREVCPECGWGLRLGFTAHGDDGDVEPTASCSRPSCGFYY